MKNQSTIHHVSLKNIIDSSNMNPKNWLEIADIIKTTEKMNGFVILHGSDTIKYHEFYLRRTSKSFSYFTGVKYQWDKGTDAIENLVTIR